MNSCCEHLYGSWLKACWIAILCNSFFRNGYCISFHLFPVKIVSSRTRIFVFFFLSNTVCYIGCSITDVKGSKFITSLITTSSLKPM